MRGRNFKHSFAHVSGGHVCCFFLCWVIYCLGKCEPSGGLRRRKPAVIYVRDGILTES